MVRKSLAVLLAVSWIVLSDIHMLEGLDFESRDTASTSSFPSTAKPVKVSSDHIKLANRNFDRPFSVDLESETCAKLAALSLAVGVLRSHKDYCVFLI
jgi:hypothetical protein